VHRLTMTSVNQHTAPVLVLIVVVVDVVRGGVGG